MLFNSLIFLVFFPVSLIGYYVAPRRLRHVYLLIISLAFYMWWNPIYVFLLISSILVTYIGGLILSHTKNHRKLILAIGITIDLGILIYFKYTNFIVEQFNLILTLIGVDTIIPRFDILLPVGISFFTFQALGYLIDVSRGNIQAERNILKYSLFVSFFPQMVAGPIERSSSLLTQIQKSEQIKVLQLNDIVSGFVAIVWGFFMKVVISDRIAIFVDNIYNSFWNFGTVELSVATVGFAIQIYCDFAAYSIIALGAAKMMGIKLMENFNTPYFSLSIKEFWHRWHISLSTWFRDYLYIPLGGSRKGAGRKYLNTMIVFCVSGLWHGASLSFLAWGGLHGAFQIFGEATRSMRGNILKKLKVDTESFSHRFGQTLIVFVLVCFAWIFFRADSISYAFSIIGLIFTNFNPWVLFDGSMFLHGLDHMQIEILGISLLILFVVDNLKYKKNIRLDEFLTHQSLWFNWLVVIGLLFATIIFGAYGPNFDAKQFIYFQF